MKKTKSNDSVTVSIFEMFCLLSAFSGEPLESVKSWKLPYFLKMYSAYRKDLQLRQVKL